MGCRITAMRWIGIGPCYSELRITRIYYLPGEREIGWASSYCYLTDIGWNCMVLWQLYLAVSGSSLLLLLLSCLLLFFPVAKAFS